MARSKLAVMKVGRIPLRGEEDRGVHDTAWRTGEGRESLHHHPFQSAVKTFPLPSTGNRNETPARADAHIQQGRGWTSEKTIYECENSLPPHNSKSSQSLEEPGGARPHPYPQVIATPQRSPGVLSVPLFCPILAPFTQRENWPIVSSGRKLRLQMEL